MGVEVREWSRCGGYVTYPCSEARQRVNVAQESSQRWPVAVAGRTTKITQALAVYPISSVNLTLSFQNIQLERILK
jgi:hypothetical protein